MNKGKKNLVITGGHLTPALAVIAKLKSNKKLQIYYFGRKYSFEGKQILSEEFQIVPKSGVKFISLTTGRLQRKFTRYTLPSLLKIPLGFFQAFYYLIKIKPSLILSFGSYVSVPVVITGWLLGIPIISHEQTIFPGLANKINAKFSSLISVSHKESLEAFPSSKTILTGNPVRQEVFKIVSTPFLREVRLQVKKTRFPLIYITGGNQGARIINQTVRDSLPQLLKKHLVVHQTGSLDFQSSINFFDQLPEHLKERYFIKSFVYGEEIGWLFKGADLIISRSGANTCWEIGALGKPAILIPIPFSSSNEQLKNAQRLANFGLAEIIEQKNLSSERLLSTIKVIFDRIKHYRQAGLKTRKFYPRTGLLKLIRKINEILDQGKGS
jgi:UDP-N-acetylglucosamine--N-acetylmuramyl-(pentapeptide) pyrophosphoryl-undecaprenol N-acetylglucosamine transferase